MSLLIVSVWKICTGLSDERNILLTKLTVSALVKQISAFCMYNPKLNSLVLKGLVLSSGTHSTHFSPNLPLRFSLRESLFEFCKVFARAVYSSHLLELELSPLLILGAFEIFRGYAVAQLVEVLCYKPEGRGFDSRWCHWNFSLA
jgi:hypothetical protein